jgi:RHS repeat-associated protein
VNTETYYVGAFETIKTDNSLTHQYTIGNMLVREDVYTGKMTRKLMIRDHLGSVLATSELNDDNTQAFISQTFRYDPFGQQFALQESGFAAFTGYFRHGFTGHEMLNELNIIHMNGRIYDPTIGRFLQADPFIQAPTNSQSYNRYSYVLNNPLSYTDPSGYFFKKLFKGIKKYWRTIAAVAVAYYTGDWASGLKAITGITSAVAQGAAIGAIAGGAAGFVATGSIKGTLQGALSGAIFGGIGGYFNGGALEGGLAHIGSHGLAGGVLSELQGGNFGHGFWSAGLTKAANVNGIIGMEQGLDMTALRVATAAVIGGTISQITGGKFANGATTAAFAQAFNGEKGAAQADRQNKIAAAWKRYKAWMANNTSELNLSVDVTVMWGDSGGQFGFAFGIGDDGMSFTGFATELTHDVNSPLMRAGSYFIGASGAVGGSVTDYVEADFFSGSTGVNDTYTASGGFIKSFGLSSAVNPSGLNLGVAKYGPGFGLMFADGKQHYATGRINW